jgi:serine/threonine protein kinase
MDEEELEILNDLPRFDDHSGQFSRKFGSYQGDLVLLTEFCPPSSCDTEALEANMNDLNRTVEDDFIFDYRGSYVCSSCDGDGDGDGGNSSVIKSMVLYPEGGLLSGIIFSDVKLGWSFRIQIAINIARVLCHLHNNNIIHNDVHPQALALDSEWSCKLLDMFYAVRVEDIYSQHKLSETGLKNDSACAAPEVHAEGTCSAASDIYSFGLCLFEICSRVLVSSIHKDHDLYRESAADVVLDHLPDSIPDSLRELIRQMLSFEAEYRPTIEDVLDWLESLLTETCLEDDPPLPPLPPLPFPERRKSARMSRGTSFNSPARKSSALQQTDSESVGSADRRPGRGGYAISKTDADRLKTIAKQTRESEFGGSRSDCIDSPKPQDHLSESSISSNIMIGVANETATPDLEGYLQLKVYLL